VSKKNDILMGSRFTLKDSYMLIWNYYFKILRNQKEEEEKKSLTREIKKLAEILQIRQLTD